MFFMLTEIKIAARADLDALATSFAGIEQQREIVPGSGLFVPREATSVAVHKARLTVKAQTAGHASRRLFVSLLMRQCLIDLQLGVIEPFLLRSADSALALVISIVVRLNIALPKLTKLPRVDVMRLTTKLRMRCFGREASLGHGLAGNGRSAVIATCPDVFSQPPVLLSHQPLVVILLKAEAIPVRCLRYRNDDRVCTEQPFSIGKRIRAAAPLLVWLAEAHFLHLDMTNRIGLTEDLCRRHEKVEINAFTPGIFDFVCGGGHLLRAATIQHRHRRPLPPRTTSSINSSIPATYHNNSPSRPHGDSLLALTEVSDSGDDSRAHFSGDTQPAGSLCTQAEKDEVVAIAKFVEADIDADLGIAVQRYRQLKHTVDFSIQNGLGKPKVRNRMAQHAARHIVPFIQGYLVSPTSHLVGKR